jgi:hypothetical protein
LASYTTIIGRRKGTREASRVTSLASLVDFKIIRLFTLTLIKDVSVGAIANITEGEILTRGTSIVTINARAEWIIILS